MSLSLQLFNELIDNARTLDDDKRTEHERIMDSYRYDDFIESKSGSLVKTVFLDINTRSNLDTHAFQYTGDTMRTERMRSMVQNEMTACVDVSWTIGDDMIEWSYRDRSINRTVIMQFINHESSMDYDVDTIEDISLYASRYHSEFTDGNIDPTPSRFHVWINGQPFRK